MSHFDYDLFVIGAGSAGVRAARMSAGYGARVAIAEERYLGGTCVNVGCVPKKFFVYASHFHEDLRDAAGYGWELGTINFNWQRLLENKNAEIRRLNGVYDKLLQDAGVERYDGHAALKDDHTVTVNGSDYTAERFLIATGGWPSVPEIPGREHVMTSNEAFYLERLPERIVIVGGGYIAVEFAGIFNGLGVDTTLVYRGPLFMRGFDEEVRALLAEEMHNKGVELVFDTTVERIDKDKHGHTVYLSGDQEQSADQVMYATGRKPLTEGLGLEAAGVELDDNGAVIVDEGYCSSVNSIYALGDVTNRFQLTPVATAEGTILARNLFSDQPGEVDYNDIPSCVFSQPNLGTVGLTEAEARQQYGAIDVYKTRFRALKHTLTDNPEKTFMKLVVDRESDRVVGIHMLGPEAGEIIQGLAVAMKAGASKAQFDATIGIHPTSAEEFVTLREPAR